MFIAPSMVGVGKQHHNTIHAHHVYHYSQIVCDPSYACHASLVYSPPFNRLKVFSKHNVSIQLKYYNL